MDKDDQIIELLKEIRDNQKTQIGAIAKAKSFNVKLYAVVVLMLVAFNYLFYYFAR